MTVTPGLAAIVTGRSGSERQIGALLVDAGKLTVSDAERIMRYQREHGLKFGEAALKMGQVTEADIREALSAQFDYAYLHSDESGVSREVIAAYQPFSPQVEQLRAIRSQLMLRWFSAEKRVLAVVSPGRKEGRSYAAANLAVTFSQLGERTLLIDADLRNPRQHELFNVNGGKGLSTYLAGRAGDVDMQRVNALIDLSVLPAGPVPPNPQELLSRGNFAALLQDLSEVFDIILIDTPGGDLAADAQTLAVTAGGALMLARRNRTAVSSLQAMSAAVAATGGRVVGSVMNNF